MRHAPQNNTFALVDLHSGRTYSLQPGPNSIGRSNTNRVVLDDCAVSRRHAVLMVHETGACEVGDAQSRNGVFLNGRRVQGVAQLSPGELLQIDCFRLLLIRNTATGSAPMYFTDEALGVVVWNAADSCWHFGMMLGVNRFVPALYSPTDPSPPDRVPPDWEVVRACFHQVKAHEAEARALVVDSRLEQVIFTASNVTLVYGKLPAGVYCVTIDRAGNFVSGPVWVPNEVNNDN
jgi:hypothetical protein